MPAVPSRKRNSFLGSLALLLALPAVALSYFDFPGLPNVGVGPFEFRFSVAVGVCVVTFALLSLLLAGQSRRTGTEIPLAALIVASAALAIGFFSHRAVAPIPTASKTPVPAPTPGPTPALTKPPSTPPASPKKPTPIPPTLAQQSKSAVNTAATATLRQRNLTVFREAESQFDQAKSKVIESLQSDPAYTSAKAESDSTLVVLKQARASYPPGSPALITASQTALAAHDKLQVVIDAAMEKDPDAREAKANLDAARAAMKSPTGGRP